MLFIRTPSTLAREVMKAKKGTPFLRSLFFATPNEPREWLRGKDLNQRPSGYEPDELPDCSTPRYKLLCSHSAYL